MLELWLLKWMVSWLILLFFCCSQVEIHSLLWKQINILLLLLSHILYFPSFFAESDLDDLIDEIIKTNNRGVSIGRNRSAVASWSFGQSFFFSSTVVTTIGYGHQTPLSPEGKFFCILYALIGIPMTMLLITAVVDKLMMPVNLLLIWINNTMGHLYSPFSLRLFHLLLVIYWIILKIVRGHYNQSINSKSTKI